jgi:RNA polymerase sigma-70 factor (ECF subfamily)
VTSLAATTAAETVEGLVRLAVSGDEAAFTRIVERHHEDMVRVCFVVAGDYDIAEEATASAWPIVWRRLGSLREPDRLRPWLCSVAANEARQIVRRRRRRNVREIAIDEATAKSASSQGDPAGRSEDIDLANALARLDPDDRALLALRYVAGLSATELARALGISPSGTRAKLARLMAHLRKELGDV